jgi:hypothetical protein
MTQLSEERNRKIADTYLSVVGGHIFTSNHKNAFNILVEELYMGNKTVDFSFRYGTPQKQ